MFAVTGKTWQIATNPREGAASGLTRNDFLRGILVTLGLIAAIEILASTAFHIPNAGVVLLLAVAYAAFTGSTRSGLASAVIVSIYVAWDFSISGELFRYSTFNFNRLMVLLIVAPAMALMVGALKRRSRLYAEMAITNATLQAQIAERKRTHDALQESRDRLRRSQTHADIGTWDWNVQTGDLYCSERIGPLFGYAEGELETTYENFLHAVHPEDRQFVVDSVNACVNDGAVYEIEHRIVWPDGTVRWVHERGDVVRAEDGTSLRMLGVLQDITGRKTIETALKESEEKYRAITDYAGEAILIADLDGNLLDINRQGEHLLGYTKDEIVKMRVPQIHPREELERVAAAFEAIGRGETAYYNDGFVLTKDGRKVPIDITANAIEYGGKKMAVGMFRDMTAHKQAEEVLRESEARFRQLAENVREVFWVRDVVNDRILYVSPAYEQIWGRKLVSFDEAYRSFQESIHHDDRTRLFAIMERQSREKTERVNEYRIVRPDGAVRWIRSRTFPVLDDSGNTYRVVGVAEDITDLKYAEEERVAHALKQRDTLVREVHHRVKNNLQAVAGLLMHETYDHPELQPLLQKAIAQVQLIAVVHGIQGAAEAQAIPLCEMVPAIARIVESLTQSRIQIDVAVDMPRPAQICERESVPIALILNELLLNATKHSPQDAQPGRIRVTLRRDDNNVEIRIFNSGSLPPGFNFAAGIATSTGLGLVGSLMPRQGAQLTFRGVSGGVEAVLKLGAPVIDAWTALRIPSSPVRENQ